MWNNLSNNLGEESALLGSRITPGSLKNCFEAGNAIIEVKNDKIIAFAAIWDMGDTEWYELGSMWVHPAYRAHKYGSKIFTQVSSLRKKGIFLITHNPRIVHLAEKNGFTLASKSTWFNVPYSVTCGPCDRLIEHKHSCTLRATSQCLLYYK